MTTSRAVIDCGAPRRARGPRRLIALAALLLLAFAAPSGAQTWSSLWSDYHDQMLWGDRAWSQRRLQELPTIVERELIDTQVIPGLIELLAKEKDNALRANAAWALGEIAGPDSRAAASDALLAALQDPEDRVRAAAAQALGVAYVPERGVDLLELARDSAAGRRLVDNKALKDDLRVGALWALAASEDAQQVPGLIELFDDVADSKHGIKSTIARALGRCGRGSAEQAAEFLHDQLSDHWLEESVRSSAARALAELGQPSSLPVLTKVFGKLKSDEVIQASILLAIGEIAEPSDTKALKLLLDEAFKNDDAGVRARALMAATLLLADDTEASANSKNHKTYVSKLKAQLKKPKHRGDGPLHALAAGYYSRAHLERGEDLMELVLKELDDVKDPKARGAYALSMGLGRGEDYGEVLLELFRDTKHTGVRASVAEALGMLGNQDALAVLREELGERGQAGGLISDCATAMMLLSDTDALTSIATLLADSDNIETRASLVRTYGTFRTPAAVSALHDIVTDAKRDDATRRAACTALGRAATARVTSWAAPY